jgi:hypothetical protein
MTRSELIAMNVEHMTQRRNPSRAQRLTRWQTAVVALASLGIAVAITVGAFFSL